MRLLFILLIIIVIILLLFLLFPLVEVCGDSMHPTYKHGEIVIATRIFSYSKIKVGDVFIYRPPSSTHEEVTYVIKRVRDVRKSDRYLFFIGDNENNSYDSRNYGYVSSNALVAKVIKTRKRGDQHE